MCPQKSFISLYLLLVFTVVLYVSKRLQVQSIILTVAGNPNILLQSQAQQILDQTRAGLLARYSSSVVAVTLSKIVIMLGVLSVFIAQVETSPATENFYHYPLTINSITAV